MSRLFKRKAQVLIGKLGFTGRLLEGVRVSFDIDMDDNKETNTGKINIYNLSEETKGLLEKKDTSVILKIGYDGAELSTLFIGNVVEHKDEYNGTDIITRVICKDGYIPLSSKKITLSFSPESTTRQILEKIVGELNLAKGDYSSLPNYSYKQGFSFIGSPGSALDIVLARIGHEWTIVNNVLIITKPNESDKTILSQFLSPSTGLIGKPERFKEELVKTKIKNNKSTDGWKIRCLIIPSIQPKNLIKVESSNVNGTFLVKAVKFVGDTHDNYWSAEIKAIEK